MRIDKGDMHSSKNDEIKIKFSCPDIDWGEIFSAIRFLRQQIDKADNYSDKSLFFQNPDNITRWLHLVKTLKHLEAWDDFKDIGEEWENRTETYVSYLLSLRDLHHKYQSVYRLYYEKLKKLLDTYGGWLEGECLSAESIKALADNNYGEELNDVEDIEQHLATLNSNSLKARSSIYYVLSDIFSILMAVMNRGGQIVIDMNPSMENIVKAIDDDLKEWTRSFGKSMFEEMKEDLTRHYKEYRTAPYTPELWGEMLSADEEALLMASKQQLANCNAVKQEHWGEDMKIQMDENGELMHLIYSSCRTERLFDIEKAESSQELIALLTPDNLSIFYDIIVRRNLIQCEMFPELKKQHEEWLTLSKDDNKDNNDMLQTLVESEEGVDNGASLNEEQFHFIHPMIDDDEERWRIHNAIKRLIANYSIPEICNYLKEQKGKLLLPSNPSVMYNELVRLGMPNGKGFSEKNFSNSYMK